MKMALKDMGRGIKKNPLFYSTIILIVIISVFFRTYKYTDRVYIQADNSRDVQVARYAADNFRIPQTGQFSSAGPFFYGPWYYWFLEIVSFLPFGFLTPWYVLAGIYFIFIYLVYWLGKEVGGKYVGLISSLFAAISPAQINYSFSVWNPAIVPVLSLLVLIFLVRIDRFKKARDIFVFGFVLSLTMTIHFQSILLAPSILIALFLIRNQGNFLKKLLILFLGLTIPIMPLIVFDVRHNWYNFTSIFIYLAIDQYRIWVPNRWLIYLGTYWPDAWSYIVGGSKYVAGLIIILISFFSLLKLRDFSKSKIYFIVSITFLSEIIMYRYYRGERFQYYSLFAHPAVLVLSAWVTHEIIRVQKYIGFVFLVTIIFFTSNVAFRDINERTVSLVKLNNLKQQIYSRYHNEKFDIYGCKFNAALVSHPLALSMYYDGRNEVNGIKIGVCSTAEPNAWITISTEDPDYSADSWINFSTANVYKSTTEWWIENPPGKGDFLQFLKRNLNPKCYPHC